MLIIENDDEAVEKLNAQGFEAITGNAAATGVLEAANIAQARGLLVAHLTQYGASQVIKGETEIAHAMVVRIGVG